MISHMLVKPSRLEAFDRVNLLIWYWNLLAYLLTCAKGQPLKPSAEINFPPAQSANRLSSIWRPVGRTRNKTDVIYRISMVRDNCFVPRVRARAGDDVRVQFPKVCSRSEKRSSSPSHPIPSPYTNTCREFPRGSNLDTD